MTATFFEYLGWVSLSPNLKQSFNKTLDDAEQHRHAIVDIEHLLFALVDDPEGAIALNKMAVDRDDLRHKVAEHLDAIPAGAPIEAKELQPGRELKKLMAKASDQADNERDDHIDGGDVIRALAEFKTSNSHDFLTPVQKNDSDTPPPQRHTRARARKALRTDPMQAQRGEQPMEPLASMAADKELNFDVDPIRASIKAIMARRRDAEEILFECEWYHLFKSLNMIDEGLEGEEQTHRARLLARAEQELTDRPRCRKAFLYVRHLDKELTRLQGIVDIDWAGDFSPDQAVSELARLRAQPRSEKIAPLTTTEPSEREILDKHLFDVKIQESEVLALEQKLLRLDKTAGNRKGRLQELESHLEHHDTHSKKRENVIGELERYLRSEMQMADTRDQRIVELEKELHSTKTISDIQVDKASNLEHELSAFKEHAGNREMLISDLEAKLKAEKDSAESQEEQVNELRAMLASEKQKAETHRTKTQDLQKVFEEEKKHASEQEQQVRTLESNLLAEKQSAQSHERQVDELRSLLTEERNRAQSHDQQIVELKASIEEEKNLVAKHGQHIQNLEADLKSRLEELQAREEQMKQLQQHVATKDSHMLEREEQIKKLQTDLSAHENKGNQYKHELHTLEANHKTQVQKLLTNLQDQESNSRVHQQEISALRAQLVSLETRLQDQETTFSVEKITLAETIAKMRREIEESESLIEVISASGEPYRINSDINDSKEALVKIVHRRTIPIPAKPRKS